MLNHQPFLWLKPHSCWWLHHITSYYIILHPHVCWPDPTYYVHFKSHQSYATSFFQLLPCATRIWPCRAEGRVPTRWKSWPCAQTCSRPQGDERRRKRPAENFGEFLKPRWGDIMGYFKGISWDIYIYVYVYVYICNYSIWTYILIILYIYIYIKNWYNHQRDLPIDIDLITSNVGDIIGIWWDRLNCMTHPNHYCSFSGGIEIPYLDVKPQECWLVTTFVGGFQLPRLIAAGQWMGSPNITDLTAASGRIVCQPLARMQRTKPGICVAFFHLCMHPRFQVIGNKP